MPWISTKEAALVLGKSERTVQRHAKSGKLNSREVPGIGGKGIIYEVFIDSSKKNDRKNEKTNDNLTNDKNHKKTTKKDEKTNDNLQIPTDQRQKRLFHKSQKDQRQFLGQPIVLKESNLNTHSRTDQRQKSKLVLNTVSTSNDHVNKDLMTNDNDQRQKSDNMQNNLQPTTEPYKELTYKDLKKSFDWISLEDSLQLSSYKERTIYNKINRKQILKIVVIDPDTKRGKRTFLHIDGFPADVKEKWKEKQLAMHKKQLPEVVSNTKADFDSYPEKVRAKANARKKVVESFHELKKYAKKEKLRIVQIEIDWINQINEGEVLKNIFKQLDVDELTMKTVRRWDKLFRDSGCPVYPICLIDKRQLASGRKSAVDELTKNEIRKLSAELEYQKPSEIYNSLKGKYDYLKQDFQPTLRMVTRIVKETRKDKFIMNLFRGKKSYKDNIRQHVHRENNALPMDLVESDGHTLNIFTYSPFYGHRKVEFRELVRPVLIAWYDIGSGLVTGWCLSVSETPNAVRTSFIDMCEKYGVPDWVRLDNSKSFKNAIYMPYEFAKLKKNTAAKMRAAKMLALGDEGLFMNMGCKYTLTIPGNSESKAIEPFWNYAISPFEKSFKVWTGQDFNRRPEKYKITKRALIKKYGDQIPTWEQATQLIGQYINMWNNQKRDSLRSISGEKMSPIEDYKQYPELIENKPSRKFIDEKGVYPYAISSTVRRGEIYVNGIYYHHPYFKAHEGIKLKYIYDERDISQVRIVAEDGGVWKDPALAIKPGLQVGDDMEALKQAKHNERVGVLTYEALANSSERNPTRNSLKELVQKQDISQDLIKDSGTNKSIGDHSSIKRRKESIEKDRQAVLTPAPKQIDFSKYADQIKPKETTKEENEVSKQELVSKIKPKPKRKIVINENEDLLNEYYKARKRLYGETEEV